MRLALLALLLAGCALPPVRDADARCRCWAKYACSWPLPDRKPVCEFIGDGAMGDPASDGDGALPSTVQQ